jgi:23S rRNA pseudouridine2605 synthase
MEQMRLQKFLAESAVASRRKAEDLIKQGRVSVNGSVVTEMGLKVSVADEIKVDDKLINCTENKIYILLHKPEGIITSVKDQFSRKTVIDLIKKDIKERVYPVGRLDYDTSGLLILSNDGDFTYKLTHPKHEIEKVYRAEVRGLPDENDVESFAKGIELEEFQTAPAKMKIIKKDKTVSVIEITIHEGKNRQVRKMCDSIGHPVIKLKRVAIGRVKLGDLPEGEWRYLSENEIRWLI